MQETDNCQRKSDDTRDEELAEQSLTKEDCEKWEGAAKDLRSAVYE